MLETIQPYIGVLGCVLHHFAHPIGKLNEEVQFLYARRKWG